MRAGDLRIPAPARAAIAGVTAAFAVLVIQDYFDKHSLLFAALYTLVLVATLLFVGRTVPPAALAPGGEAPPAGPRAATRIASLAWAAACAAASLFPSWHSPPLIAGAVAAGALVTSVLVLRERGELHGAVLPAAASYVLMISSPVLYMEHEFNPDRGAVFTAAIAAVYALAAVPTAVRMRPARALLFYLAAGTVIKALGVWEWEIDPEHRDQVPLIHNACRAFLSGRDPYRLYYCAHDLPLTYLPLMWLSYLPGVLIAGEPRLMSLAFALLSAVLIARMQGRDRARADLYVFLAALWYLHSEPLWVTVLSESTPYWICLLLFFNAVRREQKAWAALFLGLLMAVRHFSYLFLPFAAVWFLAERGGPGPDDRARFRAANLFYLLLAALVPLLFIAPFLVTGAPGFFYGTLHWITHFGMTHVSWWNVELAFSPVFYHLKADRWLPLVQGAGILAAFAAFLVAAARARLAWRFVRTRLWLYFAAAYIFFLLFNSLVWRYLHLGGLLILLSAMVLRVFPDGDTPPAPGRLERLAARVLGAARPRAAAFALLFALDAGVGGWSLLKLYEHFDRSAMRQDAKELAPRLGAGDLLVDYAYFNAWPIMEGTPFDQDFLSPEAMRSVRLRSQFPPVFNRTVIVSSGSHFAYPDDIPDLMGYGRLVSVTKLRRLTAYFFENPLRGAEVARLSADPSRIRAAAIRRGGTLAGATRDGEKLVFPGVDPRFFVGPIKLPVIFAERPCIFAYPPDEGELNVSVALPAGGRAWIATALADYAVWPGKSPVRVDWTRAGEHRSFVHPNVQGLYVWDAGPVEAGDEARLGFSAADSSQRFFCFDVVITEPPAASQ